MALHCCSARALPNLFEKGCLTVKGTFNFNRSEAEILIVCRNAFLTLVGKIDFRQEPIMGSCFCCSSKVEVKDEVVLSQSDRNRAI